MYRKYCISLGARDDGANMPMDGRYVAMSHGWRCDECPWIGRISQKARTAAQAFLLSSFISLTFSQPTLAEQACPSPALDDEAEIRYIYDGDTVNLRDGRKVRLIGINTPELARDKKPAEPYAFAAKEALKKLFNRGTSIGLVYGKDKKDRYGRVLAHAFSADGKNVQIELLEQGFASAITYPPNTNFSACYLGAEKMARCNNRGLWKNTAILDAIKLKKKHTGFHFVRGRVKSIDHNDKGIWLNLDDRLTVGIRPDNYSQFNLDTINNLLNQSIIVRGWLNSSKRSNPFYIRARHPSSIQLSSVFACP